MKIYIKKTANYYKHYTRIVEYLSGWEGAVSADELYIAMRSNNENISISTVYRHLANLSQSGMIRVQNTDRSKTYSWVS